MPIELKNRRVLVLGLGASGLSMARWLTSPRRAVRVADSRDAPPFAEQLQQRVARRRIAYRRISRGKFRGCGSDRHQSRRAAGRAVGARGDRERGARRGRRHRVVRPDPGRVSRQQGDRDHRIERQEHGDGDGRRDGASRQDQDARRGKYRLADPGCAVGSRGRKQAPPGCVRARAVQFPAGNDPKPESPMRPRF